MFVHYYLLLEVQMVKININLHTVLKLSKLDSYLHALIAFHGFCLRSKVLVLLKQNTNFSTFEYSTGWNEVSVAKSPLIHLKTNFM